MNRARRGGLLLHFAGLDLGPRRICRALVQLGPSQLQPGCRDLQKLSACIERHAISDPHAVLSVAAIFVSPPRGPILRFCDTCVEDTIQHSRAASADPRWLPSPYAL